MDCLPARFALSGHYRRAGSTRQRRRDPFIPMRTPAAAYALGRTIWNISPICA
ncbi:hypothetical protein [Paraburkholderia sp. BR14311]|uniref:hypothetical protein n=1 Tax=unclassified Paraburkholderia TaxID=2615204 RepID=UPI0034CF13B4